MTGLDGGGVSAEFFPIESWVMWFWTPKWLWEVTEKSELDMLCDH